MWGGLHTARVFRVRDDDDYDDDDDLLIAGRLWLQ